MLWFKDDVNAHKWWEFREITKGFELNVVKTFCNDGLVHFTCCEHMDEIMLRQ